MSLLLLLNTDGLMPETVYIGEAGRTAKYIGAKKMSELYIGQKGFWNDVTYLVDTDGALLVDADGAYLIEDE